MKLAKFTTAEAAAQFKVSPRTIRRWGRGGRPGFPAPAHDHGKLVWSQLDLLKFEGTLLAERGARLHEKHAQFVAKCDALLPRVGQ